MLITPDLGFFVHLYHVRFSVASVVQTSSLRVIVLPSLHVVYCNITFGEPVNWCENTILPLLFALFIIFTYIARARPLLLP